MAKLGFTFGFGARDDGMGRAMSSAFDSLTKINGALGQQNRMARGSKLGASLQGLAKGAASAAVGTARMGAGLFGAFGRGMQNRVNSFNLASMASNIRGLTQDSGELSLSMESIGASYAQQARPALAMMGVTGKRLKQLTGQAAGMAYGLNVGVETVVKTMGTLESATGGTKVFFDGLKMGTKDLVKLAEVTGMATDQLGQIGGDLVASWSFTGPQAKKTLEYMVAMGNEGGVGAKMFAQMGDQMGGINEILANQVASHMRSADEIDKVLRSSVRLAGAYASMGLSQEEAAKAATATSNKFLEWQVGIERAQKVGGEMPDIFKDLAAVVGDTQTAMDLVALGAQDSTAGMQQFAKHVQAARASGRAIDEAVLGNLTKSFGEAGSNAVYLALSTDKGAAGLAKMATATVKADGALQQLAKTQSSGRTLQEGLDMAKEAFRMRIRSLTRGEVKGFVKEEIASLRELGNEAKKLGSDSTWGPVLKTFSVFDQMGAKGVFMHFGKQLGFDTKQMSKFGVVAKNGIDAVLKMGQSIAPVMESLGMGGLAVPLAGIAGWFMLKPAQQEAIKGTITAVWDQIKGPLGKALSEGWDTFSVWFHETAWPAFEGWWLTSAWPAITAGFGVAWDALMQPGGLVDKGMAGLGKLFSTLWNKCGTLGKVAIVGAGVAAIPGLGNAIGGALNLGFQGIGALFAASPGFTALGGILATVGIVAINAWTDHLNAELDKEIATRTAQIDNQFARVKGLQEANRIDSVNLQEDFGATGTAGDVRKMDKRTRDVFMGKGTIDTTRAVERLKGMDPTVGADVLPDYMKIGRLEEMKAQLGRVRGLPQFQMQATEVMGKVDREYAGRTSPADQSAKAKAMYEQLDVLAKTWNVKNQVQIDQMTAQAYNLQTRLGEVYGMTFTAPSQETLARLTAAGVELIAQVGTGVEAAKPELERSTSAVFEEGFVPLVVGNSPPPEGLLAGSVLPDAGYNIMLQILGGIQQSQGEFKLGFATVLEEATTFAMDAFYAKAAEEMRNNTITTEILGQLTGQFAGILTEDDKKVLKSSLDLSGLYGVINAVVMDGAETRKVLGAIVDNTAGLKGWTPGKGSGWEITKPAGAAG
jgi:hypothetical protein